MSQRSSPPWALYSQALFGLHYGYPLWHPAPEVDADYGPREVEIGAVGYIDSGKFRHLLNAMKPAHHPFNRLRVPDSYQPFSPRSIAGPEEVITQSCLTSHSIQQLQGTASVDMSM